jgi:hypothetical protein
VLLLGALPPLSYDILQTRHYLLFSSPATTLHEDGQTVSKLTPVLDGTVDRKLKTVLIWLVCFKSGALQSKILLGRSTQRKWRNFL